MKLIIDIPNSLYANLPKIQIGTVASKRLLDCVKNGIPLPKGHGDLKDVEKLKNAFVAWSMAVHGNFTDADIASIIYNSQTIIEADKTESEDKE